MISHNSIAVDSKLERMGRKMVNQEPGETMEKYIKVTQLGYYVSGQRFKIHRCTTSFH
jgi:hypothetical protein